jgi:hypothetical protein
MLGQAKSRTGGTNLLLVSSLRLFCDRYARTPVLRRQGIADDSAAKPGLQIIKPWWIGV